MSLSWSQRVDGDGEGQSLRVSRGGADCWRWQGPPQMLFVVLFYLCFSPRQRVFGSPWEPPKQGHRVAHEVLPALHKAGALREQLAKWSGPVGRSAGLGVHHSGCKADFSPRGAIP